MDRDDAALEMREWLEALNSVQAFEGVQRMDDILSEVISEAREKWRAIALRLEHRL